MRASPKLSRRVDGLRSAGVPAGRRHGGHHITRRDGCRRSGGSRHRGGFEFFLVLQLETQFRNEPPSVRVRRRALTGWPVSQRFAVSGRPPVRACGGRRREPTRAVDAVARQPDVSAARRHGGCDRAILVTRQPVRGVLHGRRTQKVRRHRRSASDDHVPGYDGVTAAITRCRCSEGRQSSLGAIAP